MNATTIETNAARMPCKLSSLLYAALRAFTARKALRQMSFLDDRLLADAGLNRSDLDAAGRLTIWDDPADFLATRRAERTQLRVKPRRVATEVDMDSMVRAQRMTDAILLRAASR